MTIAECSHPVFTLINPVLINMAMKYSIPIVIDQWQAIADKYSTSIVNAKDLNSLVLPPTDHPWLESIIKPSVKKVTGLDHSIQAAVLFFMLPHTARGIHLDYNRPVLGKPGTIWAINIPIANAEVSEMRWYAGDYTDETVVNPKGSIYKKLTWITEPTLVESVRITEPTLVYTDRPHDVINNSNFSRVLLSVRVSPGIVTTNPDL
jgi:hypothetical protein